MTSYLLNAPFGYRWWNDLGTPLLSRNKWKLFQYQKQAPASFTICSLTLKLISFSNWELLRFQ